MLNSIVALTLSAAGMQAQPIMRAQHPTLSPDGKSIVFSWQGDLWLVGAEGGRAQRITVHPANDTNPEWTPDGKEIVFSSNRYGNNDIFTINPDGFGLKRLTFQSSSEIPTAVSPDGRYVYGQTSAWGRGDLFRVPITGGDLVQMTDHPLETEFLPSLSPDGRTVVYNRGAYGPSSWRKPGVTGTAVGDIWLADNTVPLSRHRNITKSDSAELFPMFMPDGDIICMSNRGGWPNIWRLNGDGSGGKKLTAHSDGTVRNLSMSRDGSLVAYEFESRLFLLDTKAASTKELQILVPQDQRDNPEADLSLTTGVGDYAIAPDSKRAVISVRGELFLMPEKGGTTRRLTTNVRVDDEPVFTDKSTVLYVAAGDGSKRELRTVTIEGENMPFLSDSGDIWHPMLSPDGKMLAIQRGTSEIAVMPATGGTPRTVARGRFGEGGVSAPSFSWSPDNKWLVIDIPTERGSNIYVQSVDSDQKYLVARTARGVNTTPKFLPNGRAVYFTAQEFEDQDLFIVDLVPADPTFSEDDLDKIDAPRPAKEEPKVQVVEQGIHHRMRRLTTAGASQPQASPDSKTIYGNVAGQLTAIPAAGGASSAVAGVTGSASNLQLGPGGAKLYFVKSGQLTSMPLDKPGAPSPSPFNAQMTVNLRDEEMALFDEVWWAMDRFYYDEKFHGKNWQGIKAKFAKIVPHADSRSDFYAMMGEMMEELDSSHLGATAPAVTTAGTSDSTAFLGVDWDPKALDARNVYVVSRVLQGSAASLPQSTLKIGDRIISVDGVEPGPKTPMATLLNKKAGKKVNLKIDRGGQQVTITIKPESSGVRSGLEYDNWVDWQRAETERLSGGKFTFFHIEGMNQPSYEQFLREIRTLTPGKKGAIVDVRYNGGGSTAHQHLAVMIKTPWLLRTTRGPEGVRVSENIWRGDTLEMPTALMANSASYSNAEIMVEGFRRLIKGPIVGERTPGYVIGTGGYGLWDGGFIRMPAFGAFTIEGENLENNGRRPDHNVPFDPNAWTAGRDPQLEKAVEELSKVAR